MQFAIMPPKSGDRSQGEAENKHVLSHDENGDNYHGQAPHSVSRAKPRRVFSDQLRSSINDTHEV
jgi:hypothetical protein